MWLVFLQFDEFGQSVPFHVRCLRRDQVDQIIGLASQHGLTQTQTLVAYAVFSAASRLRKGIGFGVRYYEADDFQQQWRAQAMQSRSEHGGV